MSYAEGDRVTFTYRSFDATDMFTGYVEENATITRVWTKGNLVSLRTDSGKLFSRHVDSDSIQSGTVKPDLCPECDSPLVIKMSGVQCSECSYWFCF